MKKPKVEDYGGTCINLPPFVQWDSQEEKQAYNDALDEYNKTTFYLEMEFKLLQGEAENANILHSVCTTNNPKSAKYRVLNEDHPLKGDFTLIGATELSENAANYVSMMREHNPTEKIYFLIIAIEEL